MAQSNNEEKDKKLSLILALFLLGAGGMLFLKPNILTEGSSSSSSVQTESSINEHINKNLRAADVKRQLEELKVKMENEKAARIRQVEMSFDSQSPQNLAIEQESHAESVMRDLEEQSRQGDDRVLEPADVVERRIARDQALADYDKKYRTEYIRAFLDNARAQGLEVQLNENLEVIGIREVPIDEPLRLPNSVTPDGAGSR